MTTEDPLTCPNCEDDSETVRIDRTDFLADGEADKQDTYICDGCDTQYSATYELVDITVEDTWE